MFIGDHVDIFRAHRNDFPMDVLRMKNHLVILAGERSMLKIPMVPVIAYQSGTKYSPRMEQHMSSFDIQILLLRDWFTGPCIYTRDGAGGEAICCARLVGPLLVYCPMSYGPSLQHSAELISTGGSIGQS